VEYVFMGLSGYPNVISFLRGKSGGKYDIYIMLTQIIGLDDTEEFLAICGGI
jgi:hypothetical protein